MQFITYYNPKQNSLLWGKESGENPPNIISSTVTQCLFFKVLYKPTMVSSQYRETDVLFQGRRGESGAVSTEIKKLRSDLLSLGF